MSIHEPPSVMARALAVLGCFEHAGTPLSVRAIAATTGIPLSTVYRLVADLTEWGALDRASDGKYQVGLRLWGLGEQAGRRLRDRAHPFLQGLFERTGEHVHLAVRDNNHALYVDKIVGAHPVPMVSRIGGRLPLHTTGVGRVLLAFQPHWFREAYVNRELEQPTSKTVVEGDRLARELDRVRRERVTFMTDEMRLGASSLAVPVVVGDEVVAAVGMALETGRDPDVPGLTVLLNECAERIAQTIVVYSVPTVGPAGRLTENDAPPSGAVPAEIVAPSLPASLDAIESPSPVPTGRMSR
jgi:DNA-binding IclR family transcriptional regulator